MKPLQYDYNRLGIDFDVTDCINELALRTKLIISTQETAVISLFNFMYINALCLFL